jgi:hypothetical protein
MPKYEIREIPFTGKDEELNKTTLKRFRVRVFAAEALDHSGEFIVWPHMRSDMKIDYQCETCSSWNCAHALAVKRSVKNNSRNFQYDTDEAFNLLVEACKHSGPNAIAIIRNNPDIFFPEIKAIRQHLWHYTNMQK